MSNATAHQVNNWVPTSICFGGVSVPTRDMAESKRFLTEVLGGKLTRDGETVRVRFVNGDIVLGPQEHGSTEPEREYPHYAFEVPADKFLPLKRRLEAFGIPTHEPWGRVGDPPTLMYFRDPSGNQFEIFCPEGDIGVTPRIGVNAGGDYRVPFASLVYERLGNSSAGAEALAEGTIQRINHLTVPTRDLGPVRRFFIEIFGGEVTVDVPVHVSINVGGVDIGYGGPQDGGWPAPTAEYPHQTLEIAADELVPMKERLAAFAIPTSEISTSDGKDASFFFRDPASHLWQLRVPEGFSGPVRQRPGAGGDYTPDFGALLYQTWNDPGV